MPKVTILEPPARTEAKKLTVRIRAKRGIVKANRSEPRAGTNAGQVAQLQQHVLQLQGLVLAQGRLLALLTDPAPADLIDDDA